MLKAFIISYVSWLKLLLEKEEVSYEPFAARVAEPIMISFVSFPNIITVNLYLI